MLVLRGKRATSQERGTMGDASISTKKMAELARRLTLATEDGTVPWELGESASREEYVASVAETKIAVCLRKEDALLSIKVYDPWGNQLAEIDGKAGDDRMVQDLGRLFRTVRFRSGGVDRYIDRVLEKLPMETLRSAQVADSDR